jgi:hypothetical protein
LSLQCAAIDGAARPSLKQANRADFVTIAHLYSRDLRRPVSVGISDRLGVIAYPNAAIVAAIRFNVWLFRPA